MIKIKYTKVYTRDWNGSLGEYNIIKLKEYKDRKYSCTFVNSSGDIEKCLVDEQDLYQGKPEFTLSHRSDWDGVLNKTALLTQKDEVKKWIHI